MPSVRWHFKGGVRTVTGSCHLLEAGGKQLLIDLGLFQGPRKVADERNRTLNFDPAKIDAVIVGHAHIDHVGNIPSLIRQGYAGPIYCTPATFDLAALMLKDSAHIQARDAEFVNKREHRRHSERVEPLYDQHDVQAALAQFRPQPFRKTFQPLPAVEASFHPAGHILGAALTHLAVLTSTGRLTIGYVVDLGRAQDPILKDPEQFKDLDVLIMESTYGNRLHEDRDGAMERLAHVVNDTVAKGGKLIIPAFALGRAQALVQSLAHLQDEGKAARLPIYVDSPLAASVSDVLARHCEEFEDDLYKAMKAGADPLGLDHVTFVRSVEESKALNQKPEPCVIISASGMCEAGRILHHLRNHIEDARNTIAIVGYQAPGTLGFRLVQKHEEVRIFGESFIRRASVELLNAFSAHADAHELVDYVRHGGSKLREVYLVHGEPEPQTQLQAQLEDEGFVGIRRPDTGDAVEWV